MLFRNAKLGAVYQVRETLNVGLPHITPEYQMHKPAMTYDFDQSTIVQFLCMMRERSGGNLVSPEKASRRHRGPVSSYLLQNSNPSRLGEGAHDFCKLKVCQLLDYPFAETSPCDCAMRNNSLACSTPLTGRFAGSSTPTWPRRDAWSHQMCS